jgi:hypothetical protein
MEFQQLRTPLKAGLTSSAKNTFEQALAMPIAKPVHIRPVKRAQCVWAVANRVQPTMHGRLSSTSEYFRPIFSNAHAEKRQPIGVAMLEMLAAKIQLVWINFSLILPLKSTKMCIKITFTLLNGNDYNKLLPNHEDSSSLKCSMVVSTANCGRATAENPSAIPGDNMLMEIPKANKT